MNQAAQNNSDWEDGSSSGRLSIDELFPDGIPVMKEPVVETNENEDETAWNEMTCSVCYQTMAELAKAKKEEEEKKDGEKMEVAHQCLTCLSIMCHDCLMDWAVTTIQSLHVPDAWQNLDILKLKCSSQNCQQVYTVKQLMKILHPKQFESVSFALNKRVMQSSEDFIACPNQDCSSFGFYKDDQYGDEYHEVACG